MGTRADFYVGRGKTAEWIGSIAWDGYPDGNPAPILKLTDEQAFRVAVLKIITEENGTLTDQGWPWPWENSQTTDYAYAFDEGRVWGTCFGHGWWPAEAEPIEDEDGEEAHRSFPKVEFPQFSNERMAKPGSNRSGLIVITPQGIVTD